MGRTNLVTVREERQAWAVLKALRSVYPIRENQWRPGKVRFGAERTDDGSWTVYKVGEADADFRAELEAIARKAAGPAA